jgi:putative effector of murein hydrolase LrgA (UPF0299 family)
VTTASASSAPDWIRAARILYLVAIGLFVVNIAIGILNGADAIEFDRNQILTHVHAGTVGWLTLIIIAATTLLFRSTDRRLIVAIAVLVPVYVLAFYTGNLPFRAVSGTALLIAIGWLLVWLWRQFLAGERSLPRLAVTLGLTSFGYGAVLGVALQIAFAMGGTLPGDGIAAHASAMTFGYLVLVAFGVIEWRILGTTGLPRAGLVQVLALFLGGLVISISLLVGAEQAGGGIYLLAQLIAVVLFAVRIWPTSLRVDWLAATPVRHIGAASIWVVAALLMFMYVVFTFISSPETGLLVNFLVASDHAVYLGVVTNGALGIMSVLFLRREERGGWIAHVIFWGLNLFLLIFVVGLVLESPEIIRIGAPVMGLVLLFALGLLAYRAATATEERLAESAAAVTPAA